LFIVIESAVDLVVGIDISVDLLSVCVSCRLALFVGLLLSGSSRRSIFAALEVTASDSLANITVGLHCRSHLEVRYFTWRLVDSLSLTLSLWLAEVLVRASKRQSSDASRRVVITQLQHATLLGRILVIISQQSIH